MFAIRWCKLGELYLKSLLSDNVSHKYALFSLSAIYGIFSWQGVCFVSNTKKLFLTDKGIS